MKLKKSKVLSDYYALKFFSKKLLDERDFEAYFETVKAASALAYRFNFKFSDNDLDNDLEVLSARSFPQICIDHNRLRRIIFYDSFGFENRGLTQQYLKALSYLGIHFLYILEASANLERSKAILAELELTPGASIWIIPDGIPSMDKIRAIRDRIFAYSPEKAFLHIAPWSVEAICAWSNIKGVERFLVNLTDHAFWLGQRAFDYCIEFRDYGWNVSRHMRGIDPQSLLMLPYYPIVNLETQFQGFPIDAKGKIVLLSGGAYYKVFGDNDRFFKILQRVFAENPDTVLLFAGDGDSDIYRRKIAEYGLGNRIHLLGDRKDIFQLYANSDIYIGTYPVAGGLMTQYAAAAGIAVIAYYDSRLEQSRPESLLSELGAGVKVGYTEIEDFHREINRLIADKAYRKEKAIEISKGILSSFAFSERLASIIANKSPPAVIQEMNIDKSAIFDLYLSIENQKPGGYQEILRAVFKSRGFKAVLFNLRNNPWRYIKYSLRKLLKKTVGASQL